MLTVKNSIYKFELKVNVPSSPLLKGISGVKSILCCSNLWVFQYFIVDPWDPGSTRQVISIISILPSTSKFKKFHFNRPGIHIDFVFQSTIFAGIAPAPSAKFGHFGLAAVFDTCLADTFLLRPAPLPVVLYIKHVLATFILTMKRRTVGIPGDTNGNPRKFAIDFFDVVN